MSDQAGIDGYQEPTSFDEMMGTEYVDSGQGWARLRMPVLQRHIPASGIIQGGIVMILADMTLTRAIQTLFPEGQPIVTVELKMNFIAPANKGELIAEGRVTHKGGTLVVGDVKVTDGEGKLIAQGLGTWMMLNSRRG